MQTFNITSRQNPLVKKWVELRKQKDTATFIVEGAHLVEMAALNHRLLAYISVKDETPYTNVDHYIIHPSVAEKLSEMTTTPGIFGLCQKDLGLIDYKKPILYLDDIRDPGNLGTILRSALAFSFTNVVVSKNTVNFYNDKVLNGAQGAHFVLTLATKDFSELYHAAKTNGYKVVVTTLEEAKPLVNMPSTDKVLIVIGNEARGVSPEVLAKADLRLKIAMNSAIESLNAGVAASIIMHHHFTLKSK